MSRAYSIACRLCAQRSNRTPTSRAKPGITGVVRTSPAPTVSTTSKVGVWGDERWWTTISSATVSTSQSSVGMQCTTMGYMATSKRSVQRSFRLSRTTSDLLDAAAASSGQSRNALADRLLNEALRQERHPVIRFRTGYAGRREPCVQGTRLLVRQLVATHRDSGADLDKTAETFDLNPAVVRAVLAYYAEFRDEVDADAAWAQAGEDEERARWEREQAALA